MRSAGHFRSKPNTILVSLGAKRIDIWKRKDQRNQISIFWNLDFDLPYQVDVSFFLSTGTSCLSYEKKGNRQGAQSHKRGKKWNWCPLTHCFPQEKEIVTNHLKHITPSSNRHWDVYCVLESSRPSSQKDGLVTKRCCWWKGAHSPITTIQPSKSHSGF
jgi:hypothetical protein